VEISAKADRAAEVPDDEEKLLPDILGFGRCLNDANDARREARQNRRKLFSGSLSDETIEDMTEPFPDVSGLFRRRKTTTSTTTSSFSGTAGNETTAAPELENNTLHWTQEDAESEETDAENSMREGIEKFLSMETLRDAVKARIGFPQVSTFNNSAQEEDDTAGPDPSAAASIAAPSTAAPSTAAPTTAASPATPAAPTPAIFIEHFQTVRQKWPWMFESEGTPPASLLHRKSRKEIKNVFLLTNDSWAGDAIDDTFAEQSAIATSDGGAIGCVQTHLVQPILAGLKNFAKSLAVWLKESIKMALEEVMSVDLLNEVADGLGNAEFDYSTDVESAKRDQMVRVLQTVSSECMTAQEKIVDLMNDALMTATAKAACEAIPEHTDKLAVAAAVYVLVDDFINTTVLVDFMQNTVAPAVTKIQEAYSHILNNVIGILEQGCGRFGIVGAATCGTIATALANSMAVVLFNSIKDTAETFIRTKIDTIKDHLGPLVEIVLGLAKGALKVSHTVISMDPLLWAALKPILNQMLAMYFPDIAADLDKCNTIIEDMQYAYRRFADCDQYNTPPPAPAPLAILPVGRFR
jgi:hypothetical protein